MSFQSLKVVGAELVTTWKEKFNKLVDKTFYNAELINGKTIRFYRTDGNNLDVDVTSLSGGGQGGNGGGTPEDNDYNSNNVIVDGDSYHDSLEKIDAILGALSPNPAESLTNHDLTYDGELLFYSAKLPSGLDLKWYPSGYQPGDTITRYVIDNTYAISTPPTTFKAGKANEPVGKVVHVVNGNDISSIILSNTQTSINTTATQGNSTLIVSSSLYNNIWQKGSATVNYTQKTEGYLRHSIKHVDLNNLPIAGESNGFALWFDNVNAQPFFIGNTTHTVAPQYKYLSGIQYYTLNTVITLSYAAGNVFKNGYHPTSVSSIVSPYFATQLVNPNSIPASNSNFSAVKAVTITTPNQSSGLANGIVTLNLYRPTGASVSSTYSLDKRICTFNIVSTAVAEYFFDEARRLINNTSTPFNSNVLLENGYAQTVNGNLVYTTNDYTNKTGEQEYQRFFSKVSASNGSVIISGIEHSSISAYGIGSINILLFLEGSAKFFDMGIAYGAGGNGTTRQNAIGCKRADASFGSTVGFTFGLDSTANPGNNDKYRLIIIFRDTITAKSTSITSIVTS